MFGSSWVVGRLELECLAIRWSSWLLYEWTKHDLTCFQKIETPLIRCWLMIAMTYSNRTTPDILQPIRRCFVVTWVSNFRLRLSLNVNSKWQLVCSMITHADPIFHNGRSQKILLLGLKTNSIVSPKNKHWFENQRFTLRKHVILSQFD